MRSVRKVLDDSARARFAKLTPGQQEIREDALLVASEWAAGKMSLPAAVHLTGGWDGALRLTITGNLWSDDPYFDDWSRFVDAIAAAQDADCARGGWSSHGYMRAEEILAHGGRSVPVANADGSVRCVATWPPPSFPLDAPPRRDRRGTVLPESMSEWRE